MSFSFSFSGDDIEEAGAAAEEPPKPESSRSTTAAFPVQGKPLLPPQIHSFTSLLSCLPSKVAYSTMSIRLGSKATIDIPRRELWDIRAQLMAEESVEADSSEGLGAHDVKTGIYEGGFKSWESSVDLVKVLFEQDIPKDDTSLCVVELGCGTALPSLAVFSWLLSGASEKPGTFILADYNPSVLQLATLPNCILTWALHNSHASPVREALDITGEELELTSEVIAAFQAYLDTTGIFLHFVSGAWSQDFVNLITPHCKSRPMRTIVLGAETIYSPFALQAFTDTMFPLLELERRGAGEAPEEPTQAFIAAKRHYFGVGGSLDDFVLKMEEKGAIVSQLREETDGVRRGVVRCSMPRGTDGKY